MIAFNKVAVFAEKMWESAQSVEKTLSDIAA